MRIKTWTLKKGNKINITRALSGGGEILQVTLISNPYEVNDNSSLYIRWTIKGKTSRYGLARFNDINGNWVYCVEGISWSNPIYKYEDK